ncbi:MAG: chorismate-binding protein, partial [Pyrinomonadaceae bacterium]|nr:chorismate-binding protein [Phycisphaerales bacterium]
HAAAPNLAEHAADTSILPPLNPAPGILQGVGTVSGTLRVGLGMADVLRATFPPGSVTGAPKVRAMQIIDELERASRGPYCGAIGYVSTSGDAQFSVAIRTAIIVREQPDASPSHMTGRLTYSVGAGIVADSAPDDEWLETLVKAAGLMRTLRITTPRPVKEAPL